MSRALYGQWISLLQTSRPTCLLTSGPQDSVSTLAQSGPSLYPLYCLFRWFPKCSGVSICLYLCTNLWFCVCYWMCLCACSAQHSCVKLTVCDSWEPWTERRWRGESRYFFSLSSLHTYTHLFPLAPLVHRQQKDTHRQSYCPLSLSFYLLDTKNNAQTCMSLFLLNIVSDNSHQCCIKCVHIWIVVIVLSCRHNCSYYSRHWANVLSNISVNLGDLKIWGWVYIQIHIH